MGSTIINFFRQPYPYYFGGYSLLRLSIVLFVLAFFFNYLFDPFIVNPDEHRLNYFWICILHSGFPALIMFAYFTILNQFDGKEENWTIGKEILHLAIMLFLIGVQNFLVRDLIYNNPENWSSRYFIEEMRNTFLAGALLMAIIVPINFSIQLHRHLRSAKGFTQLMNAGVSDASLTMSIITQLQSDHFTLPISQFLYAKSEGNYVELYMLHDGKVEKWLKRLPLKDLENQLVNQSAIIRTHRAYLVNKMHISSVTGNAQGYQVTMNNLPYTLPVSRSFLQDFEKKISS